MTYVIFNIPGKYELLLSPGLFKFEVWGAQGGIADNQIYTVFPGNGGYSTGQILLKKETNIFVYVGGKGQSKGVGGFNGGGNVSNTYSTAGGGGGTDIRIKIDSLHSRVIVAGGGGGLEHSHNGSYAGAGGGEIGETGWQLGTTYCGTGGTQTSPGGHLGTGAKPGFGYGGNSNIDNTGAGGGGWYGGGASHADHGEGAGGSGYVFTPESYNSYPSPQISEEYFLFNAMTVSGNTEFLSPEGILTRGKSGDGAAKITLLRKHIMSFCERRYFVSLAFLTTLIVS
jgi:hypothetical protein